MKHAGTAFLVVMLFSTLGLWGCSQQKNGSYASRLRDLESRYTRLEEDHRAVVSLGERHQRRIGQLEKERTELTTKVDELQKIADDREELQGRLAALSKQRDGLQVQLSGRTRERDELVTQLGGRTKERDQLTQDLQGFQRELQSILGRIDTALNNVPPGNGTQAVPASRRSE